MGILVLLAQGVALLGTYYYFEVRTSFPSLFLQLSLPYFLSSFFLFSCLFLPLGEGVRGVGKNEMRAQMIAIHHMLISANGTKTVSIILELTAKLT